MHVVFVTGIDDVVVVGVVAGFVIMVLVLRLWLVLVVEWALVLMGLEWALSLAHWQAQCARHGWLFELCQTHT